MNKVENQSRQGFLMRLRKDSRGNTAILVAASLIPMVGMIGAGVDIGRAYLVRSRLQQACDAGVLAGRKYMNGNTFDANASAKAGNYFSNNFRTGSFGASNITFTPTQGTDMQVTGTASARIPYTVMQIFGNTQTDVSVRCDAKLDIGNTDVALVLDITGSMASSLGSGTRISALRAAVKNFYATLGPGDDTRGRVRYAFIPYNVNVNVGYSLPGNYMVGGTGPENWIYQTRVANMTTPVYTGTRGTPGAPVTTTYGSSLSQQDCASWGINDAFSGFAGGANPVYTGGPAPNPVTETAYSNNATAGTDWGWSGASDTSGSTRSCRRRSVATQLTNTSVIAYTFTNWTYKLATVPVGGYAAGTPVTILTDNDVDGQVTNSGQYDMRSILTAAGSTVTGTTATSTWNGCIEERDTVNTITATTAVNSIPAGAWDLDVDTVPSNTATKWRPAWIDMIYSRSSLAETNSGNKETTQCPAAPARRLMSYASANSAPTGFGSLSSFNSYVDALATGGNTIHDVGMVWGVRLLSSTGIFAADNPSSWNGEPVGKHIIFMTDGLMNANVDQYVIHGYNMLDQRAAPSATSNSDFDLIHTRRMRMICEQAKQRNITVWVIAFAEGSATDYPDLTACATDEDHFVFAADAAQLNAEFQNIATKIAKLRLTN